VPDALFFSFSLFGPAGPDNDDAGCTYKLVFRLIDQLVFSDPGHVKRKENGAGAPFLASRCLGLQAQTMMMPAALTS
jgi:hypothetical protein